MVLTLVLLQRTHFLRNGTISTSDAPMYIGDGSWGVGTQPPDPSRYYLENTLQTSYVLHVTLMPGTMQVQYDMYNDLDEKFDSFLLSK